MSENKQYEPSSDVRVGHVHLKVSDLERSIAFYSDILGFRVTQRMGRDAAVCNS